MRKFKSIKLSDVIADAASLPEGLTYHELEDGVAVSFLYNGDEDFPDSCQWRVQAPNAVKVREVVSELIKLLLSKGIMCGQPEFSDNLSQFKDKGPWSGQKELALQVVDWRKAKPDSMPQTIIGWVVTIVLSVTTYFVFTVIALFALTLIAYLFLDGLSRLDIL